MRLLLVSLIASGLALAQAPRIALVELYGVHKLSREKILEAIGLREGDALAVSKTEIQQRLEKLPGVAAAGVHAVCCVGNGNEAVLYIGIEEPGAPHVEYRPSPAGSVYLPRSVSGTYQDFQAYFGGAQPSGPAADAYRANFAHLAKDYAGDLHRVLRESDEAGQRAAAAYILGDGPVTKTALEDLQYAMLDPDAAVRAQAMRSLEAMAPRAGQDPEEHLRVEPTWFIELLNSLVWDDRYQASAALVTLTETRAPAELEQLRERALPALVDMARWKTPAHSHPAFILLGRLGGLSEKQIADAWQAGDRETVIKKALKTKPAE